MSRLSVINLAELKRMVVLESIDSEKILADRMARFKSLWLTYDPPNAAQYDVGELEFDPIKITQENSTFFELALRDRVNQAARAVTLAYAVGSDLDAIASRYPGGVPRLDTNNDGIPDERDDRYRRRVWLSPNVLSAHGTAESYVFWALTADPTLHDASATTTEGTGRVYVTIMPESGSVADMTWERKIDPLTGLFLSTRAEPEFNPIPTLQQIVDVRKYIIDEARRGLTDEIHTYGPTITPTNYKARVWLFPNVSVDIAISAIEQALAELIEKQRWLGYDHSRMEIDAALAQVGVHHAIIDEPVKDVMVGDRGVVKVGIVEIRLAGRME
jgi:phage-related baseplate assembly protein